MKGSEPPSSSTLFFSACRPPSATDMPAPSLPVRVTAATRGSSMIAATSLDSTSRLVKTPSGRPARRKRSSMQRRRLRHVRRVLEQPDVADHEGRRGEADHLPEREVPRHDGQHHAEGLVAHVRRRGRGGDRLVGQERLAVSANQRRTMAHLDTSPLAAAKVLPISVVRIAGHVGHLALEQLGRGDQVAGPFGEGGAPVLGEGGLGPVEQRRPPPRGCGPRTSSRSSPVAGLMVAKDMGSTYSPGAGIEPQVLGHGAAHQLAGGGVREVRGREVRLGPLVRGQVGRGGGPQGRLGDRGVGHEGGADPLAPLLVGQAEHGHLGHAGHGRPAPPRPRPGRR